MSHHPRLPDLEGLLDKEGRDEFLSSSVRLGVSIQTQVLRGDRSQTEFARVTGKTQTQISRLENAKSGGVSLQTLIDIAAALDIGLSVRFVDYDRMLDEINDMSDEALKVKTIFESVDDARSASYRRVDLSQRRGRASSKPIVLDRKDDEAIRKIAKGASFKEPPQPFQQSAGDVQGKAKKSASSRPSRSRPSPKRPRKHPSPS